jgi:hypothetical protein
MKRYNVLYRMGSIGVVLAVGVLGCHRGPAAVKVLPPVIAEPVGRPGSPGAWQAATGMVDLNPGPVVQFEQSCARCHGPQGSLYGAEFARMDVHELRRNVATMMAGPGQLRPTLGQVNAMAAYHLAVRRGVPFVVIDNAAAFSAGQQLSLRGEVTPGATVEVRTDNGPVPARVQGSTWIVRNAPPMPFSVVATKGGRQAGFDFPLQQWSIPPQELQAAESQPAMP